MRLFMFEGDSMESRLYSINPISRIVKRNGQVVDFIPEKISNAIRRAGEATREFDGDTARSLMLRVLALIQSVYQENMPQVEDIQDLVEEVLLASPYKKTAKAYIIYREQHARIREITSKSNVGLVDQYLDQIDWKVNENSNMSYSLQGLNNYISSDISKVYWLNKIYPPEIKNAHTQGDFHIHDLGLLSVYCVGWDLYDLLISGFQGASGKVESGPARHLRSALGQIVNFFYTLQGEAAGAQAFSNFDTLLAPFIRFDNLTYNDVKQSLQEFLFNVNVPTRVGFQTPFTNLTMDLTVPSYYANQGVVIGGKIQNVTYSDFSKEMDIFNKAFLEVMLEGDAKGRVFTFPIPTYNITPDFDWNNKNLDLLWEITAKYGIPYFANFVNSDMKPEDARSMCCRLRIDNRQLERRGGGLFGSAPLTGSIGVVTINMPRIGYTSETEDMFYSKLKSLMVLAKDSLEIKRKVLEKFTDSGLYPYMKFYLRNVKERFNLYWQNHFSTIGLVGMNEACKNFLDRDITTMEGKLFTMRVLEFMKETLIDFQEETGNNYNLEATPAEGTSYRLALLDKKIFPGIIFADNPDIKTQPANPFYTNSSQLPVNYTDDIFEIFDHQDDIQAQYTGGTVQHLFIGEKIVNIESLKKLVKILCSKYRIPYFSVTPTFSICPSCGYLAGEHSECPKCSQECEIYSRIVGYLRPVSQWNNGKKAEFELRKTGAV
jgi:ribonucleoside-triphosphate reductase